MRQIYKYIALVIITIFSIPLQAKDIHVEKAGTLPSLIGGEKPTVEELTLSGTLNGTDIRCIRQMEMLRTLDIAECKIVAGGAYYYSKYSKDYSTINDIINTYMFTELDSLRNIILPTSIKSIKEYAFSDCDSVDTIILQN